MKGADRLDRHRGRHRHRRLRLHRPRLPPARRQHRRRPRPQAGRGRRRASSPSIASLLYFVPLGVAGPDRRPAGPRRRRGSRLHGRARPGSSTSPTRGAAGRMIGLYGLAIWGGLSFGPPIGDLLHRDRAASTRSGRSRQRPRSLPPSSRCESREPPRPDASPRQRRRSRLFAPRGARPGARDRPRDARLCGAGRVHRPPPRRARDRPRRDVFTAFALTVVAARSCSAGLPDRIGGVRCAVGAGADRGGRAGRDRARRTASRGAARARSRSAPPSR